MLTDAFVPLTTAPTATQNSDFRVLLAADPGQALPFRPCEAASPTPLATEAVTPVPCKPSVTLNREGNCITSIHIQCSCGQIVDLACSYEMPAAQA